MSQYAQEEAAVEFLLHSLKLCPRAGRGEAQSCTVVGLTVKAAPEFETRVPDFYLLTTQAWHNAPPTKVKGLALFLHEVDADSVRVLHGAWSALASGTYSIPLDVEVCPESRRVVKVRPSPQTPDLPVDELRWLPYQ